MANSLQDGIGEELRRCKVIALGSEGRTAPCYLILQELAIVIVKRNDTDSTPPSSNKEHIVKTIMLEDLLSVNILGLEVDADQNKIVHSEICTYPIVGDDEPKRRDYRVSRIAFENQEMDSVLEWKHLIHEQCYKALRMTFVYRDVGGPVSPPHFLIFINPKAGQSKSLSIFQEQVQPMLELANVTFNVIVTERKDHARDIIQTYDLSSITGIIMASGDGLLYEVINGLMSRSDWETAIKTPVGMLPTGSGNALCASLLYERSEEYSARNAAFHIIRGGIQPLSTCTVHTISDTVYMSILFSWGFTADIDIESEKLRFIGESRFVVGALKCIVQRKLYKGKLHYLPFVDEETEERQPDSNSVEIESKSGSETVTSDAGNESISVNQPHTSVGATESLRTKGPVADLLPALTDPVPENWKTIEGDFISIMCNTIPLLAHGFAADIRCVTGSPKFYILYVKDDVGRTNLFSMLMDAEAGSWIHKEGVHTLCTRAFRLEPLTYPGMLTVDGEVLEYGPCQAQVHPNLVSVFSRKRQ